MRKSGWETHKKEGPTAEKRNLWSKPASIQQAMKHPTLKLYTKGYDDPPVHLQYSSFAYILANLFVKRHNTTTLRHRLSQNILLYRQTKSAQLQALPLAPTLQQCKHFNCTHKHTRTLFIISPYLQYMLLLFCFKESLLKIVDNK